MPDKINYSTIFEVYNDYNMYILLQNRQSFTMANFQAIAENRWEWIIQKWENLYKNFKDFANGQDSLLRSLEEFSRVVTAFKLGNKNNPFDSISNFKNFYPFINLISLSSLGLSPEESSLVNQELDRIDNLDIEDFRKMKVFLRQYAAYQAQDIGLGDPDAAKITGIQVKPATRTASIEDVDNLDKILVLEKNVDAIIYTIRQSQKRPPNVLEKSQGDVDINSPVTFNLGYVSSTTEAFDISLEHMAERYLGSKTRWFELVTINNLQPPYIDLSGTKLLLVSNPAINNLIVADSVKDDMPVGTKIGIGSNRYKEEARIIEKIIINDNATVIVFLSGAQDINKFKLNEGAYIRVYKPHTTRPGNFIHIPSTVDAGAASSSLTPTSDVLRRLEPALLNFGIDLYQDTESRDAIFDPNGNFKKAFGLVNVKQAVSNAIRTTRGDLTFHPNIGLNKSLGSRFFGTNSEAELFGQLIRSALATDPRFESIKIKKVASTGNSVSVELLVTIAGTKQAIPLSFIA